MDSSSSHRSAAVYQIRLSSESKPVVIARFLAEDSEGLLSIGMTNDMERRRRAFVRSLRKGRGHSEGNLLWVLDRFSQHREWRCGAEYEYRYAPVENESVAHTQEELLLKRYFLRFGEVPPLNSAIPNRFGEWPSEGIVGAPSV
jgi:hypothetical protein